MCVRVRSQLEHSLYAVGDSWQNYAYDEAAKGLDLLLMQVTPEAQGTVLRLRDLSRAFAAWDRFDHLGAQEVLLRYSPALGKWLQPWLPGMRKLATAEQDKREPLALLDLWHNALRRADQGRFDDAVSRCYRLVEWMGQWLLRKHHGILTSDVKLEQIPENLRPGLSPTANGQFEFSLMQAWSLLTELRAGTPAADFFQASRSELLNHLQWRNNSLLAHGFTPIGKEGWKSFGGWIKTEFLPVLEQEMELAGNKIKLPQLPNQMPSDG